ncbi:MAG: DUF6982 domain-containing protein [Gemmatimonadota bacterium]
MIGVGNEPRIPAIVRMGDGTRYAGLVSNFHPGGATLRLKEIDRGGSMVEIHDLDMYEVHAIFFVRELGLMRSHRKVEPTSVTVQQGSVVRIQFEWGEVMEGVIDGPIGRRPGFFLKPTIRTGNLVAIYVSRQAVARIEASRPAAIEPSRPAAAV